MPMKISTGWLLTLEFSRKLAMWRRDGLLLNQSGHSLLLETTYLS